MNLVKFKNINLNKNDLDQYELFNRKFKGKYAYVVNWTYVIALEDISQKRYIELSKDDLRYISNYESIWFDDIPEFAIDLEVTEQINSVVSYITANKYSSDEDITVEELKKFRTWLATYLLAFDQGSDDEQDYRLFDDDTTHMLEYYRGDMWDDTIKYLSKFSDQSASLVTSVSSCGCNSIGSIGATVTKTAPHTAINYTSCGCDTSTVAGLQSISSCDPVSIYRKNIYLKMVQVFSQIDFWKQFDAVFLTDFKKYVDGIIEHNFPLVTDTFVSVFADCGCLTQADAEQTRNISILQDLSKSIQYIIDDQMSGHKNFIQNSLSQWSSMLYENMKW